MFDHLSDRQHLRYHEIVGARLNDGSEHVDHGHVGKCERFRGRSRRPVWVPRDDGRQRMQFDVGDRIHLPDREHEELIL